jgi:hypothetical protein
VQVSVESVRALRDKYREIKRLRDEHVAGCEREPRRAMAALARRFPGALRELDQLPMALIEARLALLDASVEHAAPLPEWAPLQIAYHGLMRAALRIKRMVAPLTDIASIEALVSSQYVPAADEPERSAFDRAALEAIVWPQAGRLNPWVFGRVAATHGVHEDAVRSALLSR